MPGGGPEQDPNSPHADPPCLLATVDTAVFPDGDLNRGRARQALSVFAVTVALAALAWLVTACGGADISTRKSRVSIEIQLTTYTSGARPKRRTRTFSLGCLPVSGTLPFADRLCRDIARHPQAMLDPLDPDRPRSVCLGLLNGPSLMVRVKVGLKQTSFGGQPFCGWPGGTALGLYWAATQHDLRTLARLEPRLRCDDDPALLVWPWRWASINACVRGLWTAHSARLIRVASGAREIGALRLAHFFPRNVGARPCAIPTREERTLQGLCGVYLKDVWSRPTVTFVETWPLVCGSARHRWRVAVTGNRAEFVAESGPRPPQLRRSPRIGQTGLPSRSSRPTCDTNDGHERERTRR